MSIFIIAKFIILYTVENNLGESSSGRIINYRRDFTYSYLRVPTEIVFWIYDIFGNNFEIENGLTKYLKESCRQCFD